MECGYDAGDGQYFKDSSSDRLVLIWGWSDRDYINNQCRYDNVQFVKEKEQKELNNSSITFKRIGRLCNM